MLTLLGRVGTYCFAEKMSRDYEKPSFLLKSFLGQPQYTANEPEAEKEEITQYLAYTWWTAIGWGKEPDF